MATLLKKDYGYSNVLWEDVIGRVKEIIRDEYNISPYISPELNTSINSPFRVWIDGQETNQFATSNWYKEYSISINQYFKVEKNVNFYKRVYQDAERLYEIFFHNMGSYDVTTTTYKVKFYNAKPESVDISQEGEYFRIELIYNLIVNRDDNEVYIISSPSTVKASARAIDPVFNFWSLDFDGTDDEINTGLEGLSSGSSFTFSAWINGDTFASTDKTIISNGLDTNHRLFSIEGGKLFLRIYEGGYSGDDLIRAMASTTFSTGVWYNAVATYDGTNIKLYINGEEETTTIDGAGSTGSELNNTTIGYLLRATKESFFNGQMSDVAIFNSVLSSSAIEAIYNDGQPLLLTENQGGYKSSSNLVAYYRMGSGSGDDRDIGAKNFGLVADQLDTSVSENINNVTSFVVSDAGDEADPLHSDFPNSSTPNIEANTLYKIEYTVSGTNGSGYLQFTVNYSGASHELLFEETNAGRVNGEYEAYSYSGSNDGALFIRAGGGTTWNGTASNISVKKIGGNGGILNNFDGLDFRTNVPQIYDKALFSNSLQFDGVDDSVNCGSASSLDDIFDGGGSVSVWFNSSAINATHTIVSKKSGGTGYWAIRISDVSGNKGRFYFLRSFDGGTHYVTQQSTRDINPNTWYHAVVVYNADSASNRITAYLNGEVITNLSTTMDGTDTPTGTRISDANQDVLIGKCNQFEFLGNIADVAIFNSILDATNITAIYNSGKPIDLTCDAGNYNNANNLVGYWKMGDGYLDELPSATNLGGILDQVTPVIDDKEYVNFADGPGTTIPTYDFSNGLTGWAIAAFGNSFVEEEGESVTASNGQVTMVANGTHSHISAGNVILNGDTNVYRLEIDVESFTMGANGEGWGYSGNGAQEPLRRNITTVGKHVHYFIWTAAGDLDLRIEAGGAYSEEEQANFGLNTLVLNSVSIKKVNGNVGMGRNMNASSQSISVPE